MISNLKTIFNFNVETEGRRLMKRRQSGARLSGFRSGLPGRVLVCSPRRSIYVAWRS